MNTEKHIVYELLNIVRNHEHNNDEPITERLMRAYLKTFRGDLIRKQYKDGRRNFDECIQVLPLNLTRLSDREVTTTSPKFIRLENNNGFALTIGGHPVPIVDSEQYRLSKTNKFGSRNFQAKSEGSNLTIYTPLPKACLNANSELLYNINSAEEMKVGYMISGILADPSDSPLYNWEEDIYPFPSEKESELIVTILRQIFGIAFQMKPDQVQNAAADNITYHENFNVNAGN